MIESLSDLTLFCCASGRANTAGLDAKRLDQLASAMSRVCSD